MNKKILHVVCYLQTVFKTFQSIVPKVSNITVKVCGSTEASPCLTEKTSANGHFLLVTLYMPNSEGTAVYSCEMPLVESLSNWFEIFHKV